MKLSVQGAGGEGAFLGWGWDPWLMGGLFEVCLSMDFMLDFLASDSNLGHVCA